MSRGTKNPYRLNGNQTLAARPTGKYYYDAVKASFKHKVVEVCYITIATTQLHS